MLVPRSLTIHEVDRCLPAHRHVAGSCGAKLSRDDAELAADSRGAIAAKAGAVCRRHR
jgi:hypothetical protein